MGTLNTFQYRQPAQVTAIQFTGQNTAEVLSISDTIMGPYGREGEGVGIWLEVALPTSFKGRVSCNIGDWIVVDRRGKLAVYTDTQFQRSFEPVTLENLLRP